MSLEHAILGFLQYKPLTGYDLKAAFDASVRHFWPADQSQIYRTLSRLAEQGWTEIEVIEQDDRPDRKVYHLTSEGRDELLRWLRAPLQSRGERIAALVQVFFAGHLDEEEALAIVRRLADHCRETLTELRQVPDDKRVRAATEGATPRDTFFWMLTLEYGINMTQASLGWLEDVIGRIERGEYTKED